MRAAALPLLAALTLAGAAEAPPDPDLSTRGLAKAGPFHVRPYLTLRDVGYDDNVFFDASESQGDYTATAVPGLRALMLAGHRGGMVLHQEFGYVAFRENSGLNHWNSDTRARGILLAGPAVLSVEDRYRSLRERPSNEIDRRLRRSSNFVKAEVRTSLPGRVGGRAWIGDETIRYVDGQDVRQVADRLDRNETTLSVAGEVKIRPRTTVFLETIVGNVNFRDPDQVRDTRTLALVPGVRIDPSARIQGEIKAGRIRLDAPEGRSLPFEDYRGMVGEAAIQARMGSASVARLEGERALPFSLVGDNLYAVKTDRSAAFEQFLTRRFSVEGRYGRAIYDYPVRLDDGTRNGFHRKDRLDTRRLSFRYRMGDIALTASILSQERKSTDANLDRTRTFITVGATLPL